VNEATYRVVIIPC